MHWITPYTLSSDLHEPPTLEDKIRLFKEQTLGWQLDIADNCINSNLPGMRHCGFAVLFIIFSYFEMIAKMRYGYEGMSQSQKFFERGVLDVFPDLKIHPKLKEIQTILYSSARCGFYHSGMAHKGIKISGEYKKALEYTTDPQIVLINPHLLIPLLKRHFLQYMSDVSNPGDPELRANFEKRFDYLQKWDPLNPE